MSEARDTDQGALSALGAFVSNELEADYRAGERVHDLRTVRAVALVAAVMNIPLGIVDFIHHRQSTLISALIVARLAISAVAVLVYVRIPSLTSARARDRITLLWALVLAVAAAVIVLSRSPGFGGPLAMGIVLIAAFAIVLPSSFRYQLVAVAMLVVSFVSARVAQGPAGAAALLSTSGVLAVGVVLMLYASLRKQRTRRELFLAMHEQRTLRGALEQALAEIRTLRGIVPICSFCHKIRDEAGNWHRVEVYVTERTHAQFSHGLCPTCEERHYPET